MRSSKGTGPGSAQGGYSDDEVDYLLSDGGLGSSQQARIFDAVAHTVERSERRNPIRVFLRGRWTRAIGAVVVAAAACLVVWTWKAGDLPSFRRKGTATPEASATIDVQCLRATLAACPRGSTLAFSVGGADPGRFMTAYLVSSKDTQPIWLLHNEPTSAHAAGGGDLLARGARLPDTLDGGTYSVEVLVTNQPQSRTQALDPPPAAVVARARFTAVVTK